jgi:hypothetical protein
VWRWLSALISSVLDQWRSALPALLKAGLQDFDSVRGDLDLLASTLQSEYGSPQELVKERVIFADAPVQVPYFRVIRPEFGKRWETPGDSADRSPSL